MDAASKPSGLFKVYERRQEEIKHLQFSTLFFVNPQYATIKRQTHKALPIDPTFLGHLGQDP